MPGRPGSLETHEQNNKNSREKIDKYISSLEHVCHSHDDSCRLTICHKLKRVLQHRERCTLKLTNSCKICKQIIMLCWVHAKRCKEVRCKVPHCTSMKGKLEQQRQEVAARRKDNIATATTSDAYHDVLDR